MNLTMVRALMEKHAMLLTRSYVASIRRFPDIKIIENGLYKSARLFRVRYLSSSLAKAITFK